MDDSNLPSDRLDKVSLSVMASIGSKSATVSDAREDPLVDQYIQQGMMRANERALSRAQKVQVRRLVRMKASALCPEISDSSFNWSCTCVCSPFRVFLVTFQDLQCIACTLHIVCYPTFLPMAQYYLEASV